LSRFLEIRKRKKFRNERYLKKVEFVAWSESEERKLFKTSTKQVTTQGA